MTGNKQQDMQELDKLIYEFVDNLYNNSPLSKRHEQAQAHYELAEIRARNTADFINNHYGEWGGITARVITGNGGLPYVIVSQPYGNNPKQWVITADELEHTTADELYDRLDNMDSEPIYPY